MKLLLFLALAITIPSIVLSQSSCSNGRVLESCGTACPLTCENFQSGPLICTQQCVQGCFCPQGTVELNDSCVTPSDCPIITPTCTNGMIFNECGTACPLTCEFPNPRPCIRICAQGCFCPTGTVEYQGTCIQQSDCPATPTLSTTPSTLPTPTCPSSMVFTTCGSSCPLTCENHNNPPFCTFQCFIGCVCPTNSVLHNGECIQTRDCPTVSTPSHPTTVSTDVIPSCPTGMVYNSCGPICRPSCTGLNACFSLRCAAGCFCPDGQYEHEGRCIPECPSTTAVMTPPPSTPPPTPTCTNGMVFTTCGSACPVTCENRNDPPRPCPEICVEGCFCPSGMVANQGSCVQPENCPGAGAECAENMEYFPCGCNDTCGGTCDLAGCAEGCFCRDDYVEDNGECIHHTRCRAPPTNPCDLVDCQPQMNCVVNQDTGMPMCINPPYVPCGSDAFLACDSEWTYCLQQNITRRADCVSSCFERNGNCDEDSVCITAMTEYDTATTQCLESKDLSTDCPAGLMMNSCGSLCQETCEDRLTGMPKICPLVCGPPDCVCPQGLVLFRDRCVDPRLCYVLVKYPPAINPLPIVDPNTVLLTFHSHEMYRDRVMNNRQPLLDSIERALARQGFDNVEADFHGIHHGDQGLQIVVRLSGTSVSVESAEALASALTHNSNLLSIEIDLVTTVDAPYVNPDDEGDGESDSSELSHTAIIWIAVSSGVAGLAVVVAWIAVVTCCCVLSRRSNRRPVDQEKPPTTFSDLNLTEKQQWIDPESEKGKLVLESLKN